MFVFHVMVSLSSPLASSAPHDLPEIKRLTHTEHANDSHGSHSSSLKVQPPRGDSTQKIVSFVPLPNIRAKVCLVSSTDIEGKFYEQSLATIKICYKAHQTATDLYNAQMAVADNTITLHHVVRVSYHQDILTAQRHYRELSAKGDVLFLHAQITSTKTSEIAKTLTDRIKQDWAQLSPFLELLSGKLYVSFFQELKKLVKLTDTTRLRPINTLERAEVLSTQNLAIAAWHKHSTLQLRSTLWNALSHIALIDKHNTQCKDRISNREVNLATLAQQLKGLYAQEHSASGTTRQVVLATHRLILQGFTPLQRERPQAEQDLATSVLIKHYTQATQKLTEQEQSRQINAETRDKIKFDIQREEALLTAERALQNQYAILALYYAMQILFLEQLIDCRTQK